jgi:hypothetical protein
MPSGRPRRCLPALFGILFIVLCACASAPVQEMSDARQAIQAAEAVNAFLVAPEYYHKAVEHIEQAEQALQNRQYNKARKLATQAKANATKAREIALEGLR